MAIVECDVVTSIIQCLLFVKLTFSIVFNLINTLLYCYRSIEVDLMTLRDVDSNSDWREQEHRELQDLMQRRLHYLQVNNQCTVEE